MKRHRSGDVVPEHWYKGHCDLEKVTKNIGKIAYKDFRTDNADVGDEGHEIDTDKMEMSANVEQHEDVLNSNSHDVTRLAQDVQQSFDSVDKHIDLDSITGEGQTIRLVNIETNVFKSQVVQPATSLTNANCNLPMHLGLPVEYKNAQHQNPEQPYPQHSNVPIYYH